jgi:molybdopterin synthase sulfur carrier subunit
MTVSVRLPATLRPHAGGERFVVTEPGTVESIMSNLCERYPGIATRVLDEQGRVRRFVNIYVNGEDVRLLDRDGTRVNDGDEVIIAPAVAGG